MAQDWHELTKLTRGAPIQVERVRLAGKEITIEGQFELPSLAQLSAEDQVFVTAFIRSHGTIKEMERLFGISYPTVKNRLEKIAAQLPMVEAVEEQPAQPMTRAISPDSIAVSPDSIIEGLQRGEITAADAIQRLQQWQR